MHANLVKVQEEIVQNVRENLETFQISDRRPVMIAVLACAERPLTQQEILRRTGVSADDVPDCLDFLVGEGLVVKTVDRSSGEVGYELNPDMENIVQRKIQSKIETVASNTKRHVTECGSLLESDKAAFDDYDRLMARILGEKIKKIKLLSAVVTKRNALLKLLDPGSEENTEITKISIE